MNVHKCTNIHFYVQLIKIFKNFKVLCQMFNLYLSKNHLLKAAFEQDQKTESLKTVISRMNSGETPQRNYSLMFNLIQSILGFFVVKYLNKSQILTSKSNLQSYLYLSNRDLMERTVWLRIDIKIKPSKLLMLEQ